MANIMKTSCATLGELIQTMYPDFEVRGGAAPMDMDVTNGFDIEISDNRKFGHGISVIIYPCVLWSDGLYKPCHYWGSDYYIRLFKR